MNAIFAQAVGLLRWKPIKCIIQALLCGCILLSYAVHALPDFSKISDHASREKDFFAYLLPKVINQDRRILQQRRHLLTLYHRSQAQPPLSLQNKKWLQHLCVQYKVECNRPQKWQALINRVDAVPVSLALAQATKETASGTTRFARHANNLYGQWCYSKHCGLIPLRRAKGAHFEVKTFPNVNASIVSYMHNLNTNPAYLRFRTLRAAARKRHHTPLGSQLVNGMVDYSALHQAYVTDVRNIIIHYRLDTLDKLPYQTTFKHYLTELRHQALANHIRRYVVDQAIANTHFHPPTLFAALHQPEFSLTFKRYLALYDSPARLRHARRALKKQQHLLSAIGTRYRVPPKYLVALWGLETNFGRRMGSYPELSTLATLAYSQYRPHFFHHEYLQALRLLNIRSVSLRDMYGSWAGAMGQCQFLPSRYLKYAVDYNRTGHKDIWHNLADVFASTAYFLQRNGWHADQPVVRRVILPAHFSKQLIGLRVKKSIAAWQHLGVKSSDGQSLGDASIKTALLQPEAGFAYMVYPNFDVIEKWNHANFYALATGILANKIK